MYKKWHSIQGSVLSGVSGIHWEGLDPTSAEKEGPLCINFFSHYSNYIIFSMYWGIIYILESTRMLYVETMIFPISIYLYNHHPVRGRGHLCSPARSLPLSPSKRLPREVTLPWPPSPQFVLSVLEIYVIWICKTHTFHFIYFLSAIFSKGIKVFYLSQPWPPATQFLNTKATTDTSFLCISTEILIHIHVNAYLWTWFSSSHKSPIKYYIHIYIVFYTLHFAHTLTCTHRGYCSLFKTFPVVTLLQSVPLLTNPLLIYA